MKSHLGRAKLLLKRFKETSSLNFSFSSFKERFEEDGEKALLCDAIRKGEIKKVKKMLKKISPNFFEREETPLTLSLSIGEEKISLLLLRKGANPCLPNQRGEFPIHKASLLSFRVFREVVGRMEEKGVKISVKDRKGRTALHFSVLNEDEGEALKISKFLIENSLSPLEKSNMGITPFGLCILAGHKNLLRYLLEEISFNKEWREGIFEEVESATKFLSLLNKKDQNEIKEILNSFQVFTPDFV